MFNLFSKDIDTNTIKNIDDALKIIRYFISHKKWEKAKELIEKTKWLEKQNAEKRIINIKKDLSDKEKEQKKSLILKELNKRSSSLSDLEHNLVAQESKYKFIPESIKRFDDALKSIKTLILLKEWDKAKEVLYEIRKIEKKSLDILLEKISSDEDNIFVENEKKKQLKIYNTRDKKIEKTLQNVIIKESKYKENISKEKFKIRFKKIKNEIRLLGRTGKAPKALAVLKNFIEKNPKNNQVVRFYNSEKKRILSNIEKSRKQEEKRIQRNIRDEALKLAWKDIDIPEDLQEKEHKKPSMFSNIKSKFNLYKNLKNKIKEKQLLDEVTLLIEENESVNKELAVNKLANIHKGLSKEIYSDEMYGYDLYWKILWADSISWDTFWVYNWKEKHVLFLWDATGHWIQAGLIVSLITKFFYKLAPKHSLKELSYKINNQLKQDLKSRNFITGIFFEVFKEDIETIRFVWFWHEPMLVYRKEKNEIEKIIPWWLAAGIRIIKSVDNIKEHTIHMDDWDILLAYSDGIIESKGTNEDYYGIERLQESLWWIVQVETNTQKIYQHIIDKLILFRWGTAFDDDASILMLRRNENDDIQKRDSKYLKTLKDKEQLWKKDMQELIWKNKAEINQKLKLIKKEKELSIIIGNLKKLYQIWEFLALKQDAIRHIKEWWVHKDINFYLKKAIENEAKYKILHKRKKVENKFNVLNELYKKGEYAVVISEIEEIISLDWEI